MAVPGGLGTGALRQAADGGGGHPEAFPRLDLELMRVVDAAGERRRFAPGEVLHRAGQVPREMYVVVRGALAGYANHGTPDERLVGVIGERQFRGGTNLFSGQPAYTTTVAPEGAVVVVLSIDQARRVVSTNQRLGELVLAAMVARRALLVGMNVGPARGWVRAVARHAPGPRTAHTQSNPTWLPRCRGRPTRGGASVRAEGRAGTDAPGPR